MINGWKFDRSYSANDRNRMALSSLKLAYEISPVDQTEYRDKKNLRIVPNPTKQFKTTDPLYAYYEIYNIPLDDLGASDYRITFNLKQIKRTRAGVFNKFIGIFSRKKYEVSIESDHSGIQKNDSHYIVFDMSNATPGLYLLSLIIKDNVTGQELKSTAEIELL